MIFASLRFADTRDIYEFWRNESTVCGISINRKDHNGALIQWAAPKSGLGQNGKWAGPLFHYWSNVEPTQILTPKEVKYRFISPQFTKEWEASYSRAGANGTTQSPNTFRKMYRIGG